MDKQLQQRLAFWATIAGVILFSFLTLIPYPLFVPDEGRYVEIPREMIAQQEYMIPMLNSVIYLEKPPLFYWLQTVPLKLLGITEFAGRLVSSLLGLFSCALVYFAGRKLFDTKTALISAGICYSTVMMFIFSHITSIDMVVTATITPALFLYLIGTQYPQGLTRRLLFYGCYAFIALAVLAKGLIGFLLPGAIAFLWIDITRQWRLFLTTYLISGFVLFLIIVLPWHIYMMNAIPEFFDFYILEQQFLRFFTDSAKREQPFWFYIPVIIAGLFPWTVFTLAALIKPIPAAQRHTYLFLMIWVCVFLIFFSISNSKLVPYILPAIPPLALLTGNRIMQLQNNKLLWRLTWGMFVVLSLALFVVPFFIPVEQPVWIYGLASIPLIFALLSFYYVNRSHYIGGFVSIALGMMLLVSSALPIWAKLDDQSVKPLVKVILELKDETSEVFSYGHYYQDLPVYLQETVNVVDRKGELYLGTTLRDTSHFMINHDEFIQRWNEPGHRHFVIMKTKKYNVLKESSQFGGNVIAKTSRNILIASDKF